MVRYVCRHPVRCMLLLVLVAGLGVGGWFGYRFWRAEHCFRAAQERTAAFRYEAAYEQIRVAVALRPDRADIQFLAARASRRVMDLFSAKKHLVEAEKQVGETDEVRLEKQLLSIQRGNASDFVEDTALARAQSDKANRAIILEAVLRGRLETYRLHPARKVVDDWLKEPTDDARPYFWRGLIFEQFGGSFEHKALKEYVLSLDRNPDFDECRLRLGELHLTLKNPHTALPHFEVLHRRLPDNLDVTIGFASCLAGVGNTDAAQKLFDQVLAKDGSNFAALRERGILARGQGQFEDAEKWLRQAHESSPQDLVTSYQLYLCLHNQGKDKEAREQLAHHDAWHEKYAQLLKLQREDLAARPNDVNVLCAIGTIYVEMDRLKMRDQGRMWLERALKIDANHKPTFAALAKYYDRSNQPKVADHFREKAK